MNQKQLRYINCTCVYRKGLLCRKIFFWQITKISTTYLCLDVRCHRCTRINNTYSVVFKMPSLRTERSKLVHTRENYSFTVKLSWNLTLMQSDTVNEIRASAFNKFQLLRGRKEVKSLYKKFYFWDRIYFKLGINTLWAN